MEKKVVGLNFSSHDGVVEFRPLYDDGTVGQIVTTSIETNNPESFLREKARLEREWIGREKEVKG